MSIEAINWALGQGDIKPVAKLLLFALANRAAPHVGDVRHTCWPSQQDLCQMTNISSRNTLKKYIAELEAEGLIELEYREDPARGCLSNLYVMRLDRHVGESEVSFDTPRSNFDQGVKGAVGDGDDLQHGDGDAGEKPAAPRSKNDQAPGQNLTRPGQTLDQAPGQLLDHANKPNNKPNNITPPTPPASGVELALQNEALQVAPEFVADVAGRLGVDRAFADWALVRWQGVVAGSGKRVKGAGPAFERWLRQHLKDGKALLTAWRTETTAAKGAASKMRFDAAAFYASPLGQTALHNRVAAEMAQRCEQGQVQPTEALMQEVMAARADREEKVRREQDDALRAMYRRTMAATREREDRLAERYLADA